jgi:methyl-accepting chemotaxis protein
MLRWMPSDRDCRTSPHRDYGIQSGSIGEMLMFKNMKLQTKLISAFLLMGLIVFGIALVGWIGSSQLSKNIHILNEDVLPGLVALWKMTDGRVEVESTERMLLNPRLTHEQRQEQISFLKHVWEEINEAFKEYDHSLHSHDEKPDKLYNQFIRDWNTWKKHHEEIMRTYREYEKLGMMNPAQMEADLLRQGKSDSPEMATVRTAGALLDQLDTLEAAQHELGETAEKSLLELYENISSATKEVTSKTSQTIYWMVIGMITGPIVAMALGIILSLSISRPINTVANAIATTSTEMATTVEQYERVVAQQAAAVNETTTTMDELEASFRQSSEQVDVAASRARQALTLTEEGSSAVKQTLLGMSSLKSKVEAIAEQILRLSEQTSQISNITNLVSDLANQTNLLALNAAVEAARAGEHGKGFAVVAAEIRKLADQSKKSAERINTLVMDIQNATNATVMATEEGTKTVDEGTHLTHRTVEVFDGLAASITSVFESTQQTMLNVKQQLAAVRQVVEAMETINTGSKEASSGIGQTKLGVQQLNEVAQSLQVMV